MAPSQDAVKMDQWLHPYSVLIDMNKRKWLDSNGSNLMVAEKIVLYYHKTKSDMQENSLTSSSCCCMLNLSVTQHRIPI